MAKDYTTVAPVKQFDDMACWAASMEWWLRYMSPKRSIMTQIDIVALPKLKAHTSMPEETVIGSSANFGGLTAKGMKELFNHSPFRMKHKTYSVGELTLGTLVKRLKSGPAVIIYNDLTVGGFHANVIIHGLETVLGIQIQSVKAMDPSNGTFETRFFSWYTRDEVTLAWPKT
jgi:hypothetical protein